jgi:hypothetical protein
MVPKNPRVPGTRTGITRADLAKRIRLGYFFQQASPLFHYASQGRASNPGGARPAPPPKGSVRKNTPPRSACFWTCDLLVFRHTFSFPRNQSMRIESLHPPGGGILGCYGVARPNWLAGAGSTAIWAGPFDFWFGYQERLALSRDASSDRKSRGNSEP